MEGDLFKYSGWDKLFATANVVVVGLPVLLALLGAIVYGDIQNFADNLRKFSSPTGFGLIWFALIAAGLWNFLQHRPVRANAEGITSTILGRRYKHLPWTNVNRVVIKKTFEYERTGLVETVTMVGSTAAISFRSYIDHFDRLKALTLEVALRLNIPLEEVDAL